MLTGDEKRIRALFCELALNDQSDTPRFEKLWPSEQVTAPFSTVRGGELPSLTSTFNRLTLATRRRKLAVVITILIATFLTTLALWTQSEKPDRAVVTVQTNTPPPTTISKEKSSAGAYTLSKSHTYKASRRRTRQTARDAIVREAAAIMSNWQSPTATFLESPAGPIWNSLPQLDRSVKELESFLPNGEEKESNQ